MTETHRVAGGLPVPDAWLPVFLAGLTLVGACSQEGAQPSASLDQRIDECRALRGDPREHWPCLALPTDKPGGGLLALLDRIDRDDRAAIASGLRLRPFADGDNAEQLDRSLAGVIDRQPALLVEEARKTGMKFADLNTIAQMQPEDLVDRPQLQARLDEARARALEASWNNASR